MSKRKSVTVTMKLHKDGTMSMRSTGGFDLRKIMPQKAKAEDLPTPPEPTAEGSA